MGTIGFVIPDCSHEAVGRIISALVSSAIPHKVFPVHEDIHVSVPDELAEATLAIIKDSTKKA